MNQQKDEIFTDEEIIKEFDFDNVKGCGYVSVNEIGMPTEHIANSLIRIDADLTLRQLKMLVQVLEKKNAE